jgi:hypothetical protein
MREDEIRIPSPCHEDWDAMQVGPGGRERFCHACRKHVHDLSAMTEEEARGLLDRDREGELCVSYLRGPDGQMVHRAPVSFVPASRLLRRMAQRAGPIAKASAALGLAACAPHDRGEQPTIQVETPLRSELDYVPIPEAEPCESPPPVELDEAEPPKPPTHHTKRLKGKRVIRRDPPLELDGRVLGFVE